ncbi:MAG: acetylornithine deacetylase [Geminicoccaceae bacterium]|nr:MAG: acetylornithine deacetylase [Geminicoccaceae bacterium]
MPAPTTLAMLEALIGFDTVSHATNLPLLAHVEDHLARHGVAARRVYDATGTKANLFATIGPPGPEGIVLSGHVDVVPVEDQPWTTEPFRLTARDGRLIGRGVTDMKGFDAVVLAKLPDMVRAPLRRPIHLALSYDEEIGCVGVRTLLDVLSEERFACAGVIVGEPSSMQVIRGHKGKHSCEVTVRGSEAHSALAPLAVNAVEYAARLITCIADEGRRLAAEGPFDADFGVAHSTLHVGTCHGGTALNIVPHQCVLLFELRHLMSQAPAPILAAIEAFARDELVPRMQEVAPGSGIDFVHKTQAPGFDIDADHPFTRFVAGLAGQGIGGKVPFGTEGGLFAEALGCPVVVCGPGSIDQAHKPDEWIDPRQLDLCEAMVDRLIQAQCREV